MSFLLQSRSLAQQGARWRQDTNGVTVTLGTDPRQIHAAKSPTKSSRVMNEQGSGYVQRNHATFLTPPTLSTRPEIGNEFTILADRANPANVGTKWRIFDLTRGVTGEEDRCVCFRLD